MPDTRSNPPPDRADPVAVASPANDLLATLIRPRRWARIRQQYRPRANGRI